MVIHAVEGMGFNLITSPDKLSAPPPGLTSCTMTSVDPDDAQVCVSEAEYEQEDQEVVSAGTGGQSYASISILFMIEELMRFVLV